MQEMELMIFVASLFLAAAGMGGYYVARKFKKQAEAYLEEAKKLTEPAQPFSYHREETNKLVLVLDLKRANTMDYDRVMDSISEIETFSIDEYEKALRLKRWDEQADIVKAHIAFKRNVKI